MATAPCLAAVAVAALVRFRAELQVRARLLVLVVGVVTCDLCAALQQPAGIKAMTIM